MPWLDFDDLGDFLAFKAAGKASKWPRPNTKRIKCAFRMVHGEGLPFPRPGRFVCMMTSVPGPLGGRVYPAIDMDESGEFTLHGTSGINDDGRSVELDIIQHLEADFGGSDVPGIEYHFVFKKIDEDDFNWTWYWESESPSGVRVEVPMMVNVDNVSLLHVVVKDEPSPPDPSWPTPSGADEFFWYPMSECYDLTDLSFPRGAEFNGTDAYIALDHNIPAYGGPWFFEADVRLRDQDDFNPMLAPQSQNSVLGIKDEEAVYSASRLDLPDFPGFDVWFKFRLEFEWSSGLQLRYEAWIDDMLQESKVGSRVFLQYDNLGVRNLGGTPVWGNFDLKNLIYKRGTFASPDLFLDMPLLENALDLSPEENHGTTFNMPLES